MNYVVLAIPVFFLLIAVEVAAARIAERDHYALSDAVTDLGCGLLQQVLDVFVRTAIFAAYVLVFDRLRVATIPGSATWAWVACLLGVDFLYYWFHRMSHEVNAFWAAHVVHHSSEEYNLAVALRQGAFQGWISWVFYLPLAVLGFPPPMFLAAVSIDTLYQFWIHTRAIGRLGPLEWVLNTPSNHRVHHGRNPRYIDRNHGGILIVWDRLFGTYAKEEEEPIYGITTPLRSWNPVWANLHYWADLWTTAGRATRWRDRLRLLVARPGWRPDELGGYEPPPEVDRASVQRFEVPLTRAIRLYAVAQFAIVLVAGSVFLFRQASWTPVERGGAAAAIAVSLVVIGALLEGRRWAVPAEVARVLGVLALAALVTVTR